MNIPESIKIEPNMAVVFKKYFSFNGQKYNAIVQKDDGELLFFDTDYYKTDGIIKVAVKEIKGGL